MKKRKVINYMCLLLTTLFYVQRNAIGPLIPFMAQDEGLSMDEKGVILSGFFVGYVMTQIPGGFLGQHYGGDIVLSFSLFGSACVLVLVPFMQKATSMAACFAVLGFCQGPMVSCCNTLLANWIPPNERSEAVTLMTTGHTFGRLLSTAVAGSLAAALGWRKVYFIYGCCSGLLLLLWRVTVRRSPAACESSDISESEREHLMANCVANSSNSNSSEKKADGEADDDENTEVEIRTGSCSGIQKLCLPFVHLLTAPSAWAIIFSHCAHNYCSYTVANWGPTYFAGKL